MGTVVLTNDVDLALDFLIHLAGQADAAGFGNVLQPGRHIDSVAIDPVAVADHIALVDADPKQHAPRRVDRRIALRHGLLNGDRAVDGIQHAGEFGKDAVPAVSITRPLKFAIIGRMTL